MVVGEAWGWQQAAAGSGGVPGRPGEQFGGAIAGEELVGIEAVVVGQGAAQAAVVPVGVGAQGRRQ